MIDDNARTSAPALETIAHHVSIRHYTEEPLDEATVSNLLLTARRAPTSSNQQAYSFVVVRDPERKARLAELAGNQRHVRECPVFVAICADITRLERACEMHGQQLAHNLENFLVSAVDAALVGMTLQVSAESIGLGSVMIGGIRNDPLGVAEVLGLPEGVYVLYGMCLGWPAKRPEQKPRLPEDLIIHYERYNADDPAEKLREHDAELAAHYREQGRETPDAAWTGVMAQKFGKPNRPELRPTLERMGFNFD